jgi:hypothetical protein
MPDWQGMFDRASGRLTEAVERYTGRAVVDSERLKVLEGAAGNYYMVRNQLEMLGWTALDYASGYGAGHEARIEYRRRLARQAHVAWMSDPMAAAAVDLMNDFVFGRGMPKPTARDDQVQKVIDEAWTDPVNEAVLTDPDAQVALGTDLCLQSNLFFLLFDSGSDGKIQLSLLDHNTVTAGVKDTDNRFMVLYYLAATVDQEWDYALDGPAVTKPEDMKKLYYEHWQNVENAEKAASEGRRRTPLVKPPANKIGDGRVFHVAVNRRSEMIFGMPTIQRTLRWYNAFNDFMSARVDMAIASAALIMKQQVKGTPTQLAQMARQSLNVLAAQDATTAVGPGGVPTPAAGSPWPGIGLPPPPAGSVVTENESVTHSAFRLDSGSGDAQQNAMSLRAQISAATRWPQSYYGDPSSSNLATATSLELPVLKMVERRQEVFEKVIRWFIDQAIKKAVDDGVLDTEMTPEEQQQITEARVRRLRRRAAQLRLEGDDLGARAALDLAEAYSGQTADEAQTHRDLSYQFSMPSPLKRMMADLVGAIANIARTFDPNNTNTELSRVLLAIALGEALEQPNPDDLVDVILPPGYTDPAVAAAMNAQAPPLIPDSAQPGQIGDGQQQPESGYGNDNPGSGSQYGGPWNSQAPEEVMQALTESGMAMAMHQGRPAVLTRRRDGQICVWRVNEAVLANPGGRLNGQQSAVSVERQGAAEDVFDEEILGVVERELAKVADVPESGNGSKRARKG